MRLRAAFQVPLRYLTRSRSGLSRPGFTLPEILIVIVMISLLALVAIPRFNIANGRRHMESARMRIAAALATARQGAIQKGETVRFRVESDSITVRTLSSSVDLLSPVPIQTLYKVSVNSPFQPFNIDFSARGFANLSGETHIILRRSGVADDTVTMSRTGMVKR